MTPPADNIAFVLVHGGFHDGSCWAKTREHLAGAGLRSVAPTLPGHGTGARGDISHEQQVAAVVRSLDEVATGPDSVVLVGHSYAGCVIQKVIELRAEVIARSVFYAAIVVRPGETVVECLPDGFLDPAALMTPHVPVPPFDAFAELFFNDMSTETAAAAYAELSPNPVAPLLETLDTSRFFEIEMPITVLSGTADRAMPPGYEYHPHYSSRLPRFDLVEVAGGHELIFSRPGTLARLLVEEARK